MFHSTFLGVLETLSSFCNTTPNPRTLNTSARVIFLAWPKFVFVSHKTFIFANGTPCRMRSRCCSSTRTPNATSLFLSHGDDHCDDPRHGATFGQFAESNLPTGYAPNDLTEMNNTEITPIIFHRPSVTSTCDSAESITTRPPESDLDDEQMRNMLASGEREASADRSRVCHSYRENSVSSSSRFRASAGRPAAVFSHKRKSREESRSNSDGIPLAHRAVQGENEAPSRLSESENDTRLILEEQRYHLAEARSEVLKQECSVDFLDSSIRELQRQIHSSRMEVLTILTFDMKHLEESRPGFTKNWRSEKEHSEKLISEEVFMKWKN